MDGKRLAKVPVLSGVPQGTVLGPLMFIVFINDIGENVNVTIKLFTDDCVLFHEISDEKDVRIQSSNGQKLGRCS